MLLLMGFLSRLRTAGSALLGRETRGFPPPEQAFFHWTGIPASFRPQASMEAYGDNVWLRSAVNKVADELSHAVLKLRKTTSKDGEVEYVESHVALDTLRKPQPTKTGKSMLSGMDLKFITAMHLLLAGEGFWLLDRRLKVNGAPTRLDPLLPQYVYTKLDSDGEIAKYIYRLPQKEYEFDALDIVHFRTPSPQNMYAAIRQPRASGTPLIPTKKRT